MATASGVPRDAETGALPTQQARDQGVTMELIKGHHHYKKELIGPADRVASCERHVIDLLLTSLLADADRDSSVAFELKHHAGTTQMARVLARTRRLPVDVCTVGVLLHDIYVIIHGRYKGHAHLGASIAVQIVTEIGGFSDQEIDQIRRIVYHHSDKHVWSDDPFEEFGKDADILDCFLYPNPLPDYLIHKSLYVLSHYLRRAKRVWHELNIPQDPEFELLDGYGPSWFEPLVVANTDSTHSLLSVLLAVSEEEKNSGVRPPAFCLVPDGAQLAFCTNRANWGNYVERLRATRPAVRGVQIAGSLSEALEQPLGGGSGTTTIQGSLSEVQRASVPERLAEESSRLLVMVVEGQFALAFWPLAGAYEVINHDRAPNRLRELGLARYAASDGR